jgi:hypothetical protein
MGTGLLLAPSSPLLLLRYKKGEKSEKTFLELTYFKVIYLFFNKRCKELLDQIISDSYLLTDTYDPLVSTHF